MPGRGCDSGAGRSSGCVRRHLPQADPLTPGRSYSSAPSETVLCPPRPCLACWGQSSSCLAESYTSPLCWSCLQRWGSGGFSCLHVPHQYQLQCLEAGGNKNLINNVIPGQLQSDKVCKQTLFPSPCRTAAAQQARPSPQSRVRACATRPARATCTAVRRTFLASLEASHLRAGAE